MNKLGEDLSERNDNDQFAEFISQISPAIREMVDKIEKSSDNRLDIKSAFRKVFLSESRDGDDRRLDSI